ncbi:ATP-binding protein [Aliiglaciecola sp. CAU 1673]|uniref:sensor histidine kinase n=1 Tax=Aliiglaciecola sp. CAU 1673 TaxID=3032595 RepID=UPI0023DC5AB2|nr:ATP-binding protein [Aliiglaciecola sp. CAU 1673]MDF2177151.1 ATP-binding protein [Aliiglaciecola sp. CAU 1673]
MSNLYRQLLGLFLLASLPAALGFLILLWQIEVSVYLAVLLSLLLTLTILYSLYRLHERLDQQFNTLSSLMEAMIRGDLSLRGREKAGKNAQTALLTQLNALADTLSQQRAQVHETALLMDKINRQIDVAILAYDDKHKIQLINGSFCRLLQQEAENLKGQTLNQLGINNLADAPAGAVLDWDFPGAKGQWRLYRDHYQSGGRRHHLLFITDVRQMLRAAERRAWQRLVRVLSHEINNSLAPIASLSDSLKRLLANQDFEHQDDVLEGLGIISQRATSLQRFTQSYSRLTHLPEPQRRYQPLRPILDKVAAIFGSQRLSLVGEDVQLLLDADQLEQLLINLVKNAFEAMVDKPEARVEIRWHTEHGWLLLEVLDSGPGISNAENLFTPFYTTKASGSGIGLVLSRQIAEAHGGSLSLSTRQGAQGAVAKLQLPMA